MGRGSGSTRSSRSNAPKGIPEGRPAPGSASGSGSAISMIDNGNVEGMAKALGFDSYSQMYELSGQQIGNIDMYKDTKDDPRGRNNPSALSYFQGRAKAELSDIISKGGAAYLLHQVVGEKGNYFSIHVNASYNSDGKATWQASGNSNLINEIQSHGKGNVISLTIHRNNKNKGIVIPKTVLDAYIKKYGK